LEWRVIMMSR